MINKKYIIGFIYSFFTCSLFVFAAASTQAASKQAPGTLMHEYSGKCLHPAGGSANPKNGTKLVVWPDCSNDDRIKYRWLSSGSIQHVSSGKCLHPSGGSANPANGTPLVFWSGCNESRLAFELTSGGSIRHKSSGLCVHPQGGRYNPTNETKMILWRGCDKTRLKIQPGGERFIYIHGWTDGPRTPYRGAPRKGYDLCNNRSQCDYWNAQLPGFVRHIGWASSKDDWRKKPVLRTVNMLNNYCRNDETPCVVICHSTGCPIIGRALSIYGGIYNWKITRVLTLGSAEGGSELGGYKNDNARFIAPGIVRGSYNHHETHGVPFFHTAGYDGGAQSALIDGQDDGVVGFHSACGYVQQFNANYCSNDYKWTSPFTTRTVKRWTNHGRVDYCGRDGCDQDHKGLMKINYQRRVLELNP